MTHSAVTAYENEEDEKEDVLYNIAQAVNLSYFDYRSSEVVGETVEATSNVRSMDSFRHRVREALIHSLLQIFTINSSRISSVQ